MRNLLVSLAASLLLGCAPAAGAPLAPSEGVHGSTTSLIAVQTICEGPVGVMVNAKAQAFEVFLCLNGVVMLRPTTVASAEPAPGPSKDTP